MKLSELRAYHLNDLPTVQDTTEALALARFTVSYNPRCKFVKVYHREQSFTVVRRAEHNGHQPYYVVVDSNSLVFRGDLKTVISAIRAYANPEDM